MIEIDSVVVSFLMVLSRISGFFLSAPVFSYPIIPARVKMILVAVLSYTLWAPSFIAMHSSMYVLVAYVFYNLFIGFVLGFVLNLIFLAVVFFGECLSMQSGLSFASMQDPQYSAQQSVLSQWFLLLFTFFFLSLNGHLSLLSLLSQSLQTFPPSTLKSIVFDPTVLAQWMQFLFQSGLHLAVPFVLLFLMVQFAFGLLSRTAPQLQLFSLSFPIGLIFGFIVIEIMIPIFESLFSELINRFDSFNLLPAG